MPDAQVILAMDHRGLFPDVSEKAVKATFHKLAMTWHPDHCSDPEASAVFAHITAMKERALVGEVRPSEVFIREDGTSFKMEYLRAVQGQGFRVFVGQTRIAYHVPMNNVDLVKNATAHRWTYANSKMEEEMSRFLNPLVRQERLRDGRLLVYSRNPDQVLMRDLIDVEGVIKPVHVTWMISRMINLACYLEWAKFSHGAISPEFLLVSLDQHSVSICGPVLYGSTFGNRPAAVPARTLRVANWLLNPDSKADARIDLALIRETALELLGDRGGARLRSNPDMRPEITNWLLSPGGKSAIADYERWETARGERRFAHYGKSAQMIYDCA